MVLMIALVQSGTAGEKGKIQKYFKRYGLSGESDDRPGAKTRNIGQITAIHVQCPGEESKSWD